MPSDLLYTTLWIWLVCIAFFYLGIYLKKKYTLSKNTAGSEDIEENPGLEFVEKSGILDILKKGNQKKGLKIYIFIMFILLICVLGGYLVKSWIIPSVKYNSANSLLESGEYLSAAEQFNALGDFKNAKERAAAAYYEGGRKCIKNEKYDQAITAFTKANAYEDAEEYLSYANGMVYLGENQYEDAINAFENAKNIEDGEERYKEANYGYAEELFADKDYENAESYYEEIKGYEDADTKYTVCVAEEAYQNGWLNKAKKEFAKLPKNFKYNKISVLKRLATLDKYSAYLKICGVWTNIGGTSEAKVRQTGRYGTWDEWTSNYSDVQTPLTIYVRIKTNGKVNISGIAGYYVHTTYSSLSDLLEPKMQTVGFSQDVSSVYDTIRIDDYTTLKYDGKKFVLNYSRIDRSTDIYFTYTYKSTFNYPKREKKY